MSILSEIWVPLLPLLGVGLGWTLNEWTVSRAVRRDRRKPFGRTLAYLLHVHQQLFFLEVFRRIGEKSDSELAKKMIREAKLNLHSFATSSEDYEQKFQAAIDQVSEISPMLAFEIRQKINARYVYKGIREALGQISEPGDKIAEVYGDFIVSQALPIFEHLLLEVAGQFGSDEHRLLVNHFKAGQERFAIAQGISNKENEEMLAESSIEK